MESQVPLTRRWLTWTGLAVTLVLLVALHAYLDGLLDPDTDRILDRATFHLAHRGYLWVSTMQWLFGLVYLAATLQSWGRED